MRESGIELKNYGIRLDSGDLAYMSKKARKMLDEAGFPDAVISASSDLDEYLIDSLKTQGAAITSWGVGTNMITSRTAPPSAAYISLPQFWTRRPENLFRRSSCPKTRKRSQTPEIKKSCGSMTVRPERSGRI